MSSIVEQAVSVLSERLTGALNGTAKFVIADEGALIIDAAGVRAGDDAADVTLSADADTFQAILAGELNPTNAFMSGKLTVDGDMGLAMQLGSVLG